MFRIAFAAAALILALAAPVVASAQTIPAGGLSQRVYGPTGPGGQDLLSMTGTTRTTLTAQQALRVQRQAQFVRTGITGLGRPVRLAAAR